MTTSTIVLIVVVAVVAILLIATIAWVARKKRNQHRRVEAGDIRDKAVDQSHKVGQREAFADETAAKARVAQAEADAKAAHATGLQHQAQVRRTNAATARDEVNQEFERADKIDPDSQTPDDQPRQDSETRETPRGTPGGKQGPPSMPRSGDAANPRRPNCVGSSPIDHAAATANELVPAVRRLRPTKDARAGHMRHRDSSTSRTI